MPPRVKMWLFRGGLIAAGWLVWVTAVLGYRALRGGAAEPVFVTVRCRPGVEGTELRLLQRSRSGAELFVLPEAAPADPTDNASPESTSAKNGALVPFRGPEMTTDRIRNAATPAGDENRSADCETGSTKPWWSPAATCREEWRWVIWGSWVRGLRLLALPQVLSRLQEVTVVCAGQRITIRGDALSFRKKAEVSANLAGGRQGEFFTCDLPPPGRSARSYLPGFSGLWNYPGDGALMGKVLSSVARHSATWFLAVGLLGTLAVVGPLGSLAEKVFAPGNNSSPQLGRDASWEGLGGFWFWAGALYLATAAAYLEGREPRYFLQDDNFAIFLPAIVRGCEIVRAGWFPEWTTYQFLGMPLASLGTFALTYPPTYLAYFFATWALGDATWTLEIFCWAHLLVGYCGMHLLLRREGMSPVVAAWGGLCWALSGYALIATRSWYYMAPAVAFLPLLGAQILRLDSFRDGGLGRRGAVPGWVLTTGLLGGLFYHAGNAQMWLYAVQLFGLAAFLRGLHRRWEWQQWAMLAAGGTCAVAIAAPLLIPQLMIVSTVRRPVGPHEGIFDGLLSLILPYPLAQAPSPCTWADPASTHHGQFYFAGGMFTAMWLVGLGRLLLEPKAARTVLGSFWHPMALLAFVLALGNVGGLWWLQSQLPFFGQAYHPFKYLPFFHLATIVIGAGYVQRLATAETVSPREAPLGTRRNRALGLWTISGAVLIGWHVFLADTSFYRYGDRVYEPLPAKLQALLSSPDGATRVLPIAPFRSPVRRFVWSLGLDFPLIYGVESLSGYSEFVRQTAEYRQVLDRLAADPLDALREYGVQYVILHRTAAQPVRSRSWDARWAETESLFDDGRIRSWCRQTRPIYCDDRVAVFPVADSKPPAFWRGHFKSQHIPGGRWRDGLATLPGEFSPSGSPAENRAPAVLHLRRPAGAFLKVDCGRTEQGGELVLNYLWSPRLRAFADGRSVSVGADNLGRIIVTVPPGTKQLCVYYRSPWSHGLIFGMLCFSLGMGMAWLAGQSERKRGPQPL